MTDAGATTAERRARWWYVVVGTLAMVLASLPYAMAWAATPPGHVYTGLLHNIDDGAVYLAWMRQAAEGRFFLENRFSVEPQRSLLFNVWFLLLGNISKWIPAIAVFHVGRIAGSALLLAMIERLARETLPTERARRLGFGFACFGAGLGWVFGGFDPARGFDRQPIDLFQTEAITFLSLHYSPLFAPATAAIVGFAWSFLRAERTGRLRDLVPAAACAALLGNFHSYDVLHCFAAAGAYRVATDILARRIDRAGWVRLILLAAAALPTTAWVFAAYRLDPLFHARALTRTHTAPPQWLLLGFGLPAVFAAVGVRDGRMAPDARRLLSMWIAGVLLLAYLPFEFQRKVLMGIHVPIVLLAGAGLDALVRRLPGDYPRAAAVLGVLLSVPTNAVFVVQELERVRENSGSTQYQPYLRASAVEALEWLSRNADRGDIVVVSPDPTCQLRFPFAAALPDLAVWVPARSGLFVHDGHWSETLDYERKLSESNRIFSARTTDADRLESLRSIGARWLLVDRRLFDGPLRDAAGEVMLDPRTGDAAYRPIDWSVAIPGFLQPRWESADTLVYEVLDPR